MHSFVTGTISLGFTALLAIGCSAAEGQDPSNETNIATVEQAIGLSFIYRCAGASWEDLGGNHYRASATYCYRKNGSKNLWPTPYDGYCYGDISNCNGNIVCQSSCP